MFWSKTRTGSIVINWEAEHQTLKDFQSSKLKPSLVFLELVHETAMFITPLFIKAPFNAEYLTL